MIFSRGYFKLLILDSVNKQTCRIFFKKKNSPFFFFFYKSVDDDEQKKKLSEINLQQLSKKIENFSFCCCAFVQGNKIENKVHERKAFFLLKSQKGRKQLCFSAFSCVHVILFKSFKRQGERERKIKNHIYVFCIHIYTYI